MYAVISKFVIGNARVDDVRAAFQNRPHLVDSAEGFISMLVMSPPEQQEEIWLFTQWRDKHCYEQWHRSHAYHESHSHIPKGLKLVPRTTEIRAFEVFAD